MPIVTIYNSKGLVKTKGIVLFGIDSIRILPFYYSHGIRILETQESTIVYLKLSNGIFPLIKIRFPVDNWVRYLPSEFEGLVVNKELLKRIDNALEETI